MNSRVSRRSLLKTVGSAALLSTSEGVAVSPHPADQGLAEPKAEIVAPNLCLEINGKLAAADLDETGMRRVKQLGVNHVIMGGPPIPWEETQIRALVDRVKAAGLTLGNMMISGFTNTLYGRPGRDAEIQRSSNLFRLRVRRGSRWWNTISTPIA